MFTGRLFSLLHYTCSWSFVELCLFHTTDTDKIRQRVSGVNWIGDKSRQFSVVLGIFETEQLQIGNWVETRVNRLVLSPVQFAPPTHEQDKTILSCPCRRCDIGITVHLEFMLVIKCYCSTFRSPFYASLISYEPYVLCTNSVAILPEVCWQLSWSSV